MTAKKLSFDDFDDLAEQMINLAFEHSTKTLEPVGAVLGGVMYHLALEVMLNDCPEHLFHALITVAADGYRDLGRMAMEAEVAE
ncbi:hypothetical protein [Pseudomonas petrae]|uniref:hypothetical protein n=1 Tax=Pseudomonas petrae TaxID=2912190 RepID=UPI001F2E24B8|nr:hypothetical protein [Pseudomonas petrae]MCF7557773.1 hypothetical protein [Pseudomonas petrae]